MTIDTTLVNYNAVEPMYAAHYLIEQRVTGWEHDAAALLAFVERDWAAHTFGEGP